MLPVEPTKPSKIILHVNNYIIVYHLLCVENAE